jgi:biopolymer transport protein ExbD
MEKKKVARPVERKRMQQPKQSTPWLLAALTLPVVAIAFYLTQQKPAEQPKPSENTAAQPKKAPVLDVRSDDTITVSTELPPPRVVYVKKVSAQEYIDALSEARSAEYHKKFQESADQKSLSAHIYLALRNQKPFAGSGFELPSAEEIAKARMEKIVERYKGGKWEQFKFKTESRYFYTYKGSNSKGEEVPFHWGFVVTTRPTDGLILLSGDSYLDHTKYSTMKKELTERQDLITHDQIAALQVPRS